MEFMGFYLELSWSMLVELDSLLDATLGGGSLRSSWTFYPIIAGASFEETWKFLLDCCQHVTLSKFNKMAYEINEQKKIGIGLLGFGFFFSFLGVILFFDRGLLALGNIFFLAGVALLLGWRSTLQLFTNRSNYKGSISFLLGLFFIFVRWPIVGIVLEIYSFVVLFGNFWPSIKAFLYQIPVFGWIVQYPIMILDRLRSSG